MPQPAKTPTGLAGPTRRVAGVLQRLPGALEEEPVLRIEDLGLARRDAEEGGVEAGDIRKPGALRT